LTNPVIEKVVQKVFASSVIAKIIYKINNLDT